ncbi:hypothetical protein [Sorangium cellulosum]|uniref:Uncharacterized protein n=1 Tax=Sorangium cellulosum TaxID=56 RepID=A0A150Q0D7_SORCE|nr:hypothetical protein [Sorangium cellulosum]KYF61078.1 hypothetical protein BE15_39860 [Sorangium cellulosum]
MKRDLGSVRALWGAGLLAASSAGGCTTIIGLEIGVLDSSTSSATASSGSTGGGGDSSGGGGQGGGQGGDSSGGGGQGGDSSGGGGQGGGEERICSGARAGAARAASGLWGHLAGEQIIDLETHDDGVTALINKGSSFSVARWKDDGSLDSDFTMATPELAGDIAGEHLATAAGLTYVTGWAQPGVNVPLLANDCQITARADATPRPSFLAALDEKGTCAWAWSVDAESTTNPLGLAATSERVVFAVSLTGQSVATNGTCIFGADEAKNSAELVAFDTAGACQWRRSLGPPGAVRIAELVVDSTGTELLVVGDYEAPDDPIIMQDRPLPSSQGSDLFIARVRLIDGQLEDLVTINAPGVQAASRHGAALLPDGDLVIAGTYTGTSVDFNDDCPPMPPAAERTGNTFILRVSRRGLVWSRGFGDVAEDQLVSNVAVDADGSIYATGQLEGEMDLGNGMKIATPPGQISSFLLVLNQSGNVLSGSELMGEETVATWAIAPGRTPRDPLYIAGEMTKTFPLVPSGRPAAATGEGFIARLAGIP